jgi:hypothetical protein
MTAAQIQLMTPARFDGRSKANPKKKRRGVGKNYPHRALPGGRRKFSGEEKAFSVGA